MDDRLVATTVNQNQIRVLKNGRYMKINCSMHRFLSSLDKIEDGELIENAFSYLTKDERDFIEFGILECQFNEPLKLVE